MHFSALEFTLSIICSVITVNQKSASAKEKKQVERNNRYL